MGTKVESRGYWGSQGVLDHVGTKWKSRGYCRSHVGTGVTWVLSGSHVGTVGVTWVLGSRGYWGSHVGTGGHVCTGGYWVSHVGTGGVKGYWITWVLRVSHVGTGGGQVGTRESRGYCGSHVDTGLVTWVLRGSHVGTNWKSRGY